MQQRGGTADLQVTAKAGHAYPVVPLGLGLGQAAPYLPQELLSFLLDLSKVSPRLVNGLGGDGGSADDVRGPADFLLDLVEHGALLTYGYARS